MYGIDGRRDLTETTRDELSGYAGARPVRVGNGAFDQRQNDVFGAVLDSILLHTRHSERLPRRLWPIVESRRSARRRSGGRPTRAYGRPAASRGTTSRQSDGLGRPRPGRPAGRDPRRSRQAATWRAIAEEIHADIIEHGVSKRGVLRQHYETDALDASVLLAAIFEFLPGDDKRLRATINAIAEELTEDGFVLATATASLTTASRARRTFLICSFWLVSALAIIGELQRARDLMERLLRIASPLGLYAEEFDADTGRRLGNFPQAFSHLALMEAAARIMVPEILEQY